MILELQKKWQKKSVFAVLLSIDFTFLLNIFRIPVLVEHLENVCEVVQNGFCVRSNS